MFINHFISYTWHRCSLQPYGLFSMCSKSTCFTSAGSMSSFKHTLINIFPLPSTLVHFYSFPSINIHNENLKEKTLIWQNLKILLISVIVCNRDANTINQFPCNLILLSICNHLSLNFILPSVFSDQLGNFWNKINNKIFPPVSAKKSVFLHH